MYIAAAFEKYKACCSAAHLLFFPESSIQQDSKSPSLRHSCDSNEDVLLAYITAMIHEKLLSVHITPSL